MRTSRTATVLIITVALLIVWTIPAGAGKPSPELVKVTMVLVDANDDGILQGLTTDCEDGDEIPGALVMQRYRDGLGEIADGEAPVLGVHMNAVEWSRQYPESDSNTGFLGCHGGTLDGSEQEWHSFMRIYMDRKTEAVTSLIWHFDHYSETETIPLPNDKTRDGEMVLEVLTLRGNDLQWNEGTSTVSGWFDLEYYGDLAIPPFPGSPQWFEFTLTTVPLN